MLEWYLPVVQLVQPKAASLANWPFGQVAQVALLYASLKRPASHG